MNEIHPSLKKIAVFLFFIVFQTVLYAQSREIEGTITDASTGEFVIGANVYVKGTTIGTITDSEGKYFIRIPGNDAVLVVSFVGMEKTEIPVGDRTVLNVSLQPETTDIDEVIVIGYGTQKKDDLTGSVAVVSADEITKTAAPTIDRAIQGKAAGVWVTSTSGMPGQGMSIKVRGIGSINSNSEPLYVIDGVPGGNLSTINPSDIQSIQILKDASATAIYGSRAANGVVMVTTKRGQSGKPKLNFSAYSGMTRMVRQFDVLNAQQYADFYEQAYTAFGDPDRSYPMPYTDSVRNAYGNIDTDWQDLISQVGRTNNASLSISGGGENSNYAVSGNYYEESGILVDTEFKRFSIRANSDFNVTDWLTVGESFSVSRTNSNNEGSGQGNPWVTSTIASPLMPIYAEESPGGFAGPTDTITAINERTNPYAEQMLNEDKSYLTRILTNVYAEIRFLNDFRYKLNFGGNFNNSNSYEWSPQYELGNLGNRSNNTATKDENYFSSRQFVIENTLTYNRSFGNHNLTVLAGHTTEQFYSTNLSATGSGFMEANLNVMGQAGIPVDVGGGEGIDRMESLLGRVMYDYAGKYLLTASVRRDGSSKFGPNNKYGVFPSFSMGWKFSEDLLRNLNWINLAKLRLGWGATGNSNIGSFQFVEVIDMPDKSWYAFGPDQITYFGAASIWKHGNPGIQWESAYMTNVGIDINAFRNKLEFTAEYYYKNQKDMLVNTQLAYIYGKAGEANPPTNLGEVINSGLEANLIYKKREGRLQYNISFNFTTLKNEVKYLPGQDIIEDDLTITTPGRTIGSFYGYVAERILQEEDFDAEGNLLWATQESTTAPGDIKFKDLNKDGVINATDRTIIGKALPDFIYGLNFDLYYKNIDFTVFFSGMQNMEVYNAHRRDIGLAVGDANSKDNNKHVDALDFWTPENRSNEQTRISIVDENNNTRNSTWFLEDASFMRIKTLQLGYKLPERMTTAMGLANLRIYGSANNLLTFTKYSGYDPEVGSSNPLQMGIDNGTYPIPRSFLVGVQLDF